MSIHYQTIDGAKSAGRIVTRIVESALGDSGFGISKGREMAARYAGYRDWHHLSEAVGVPQPASEEDRLAEAKRYLLKNVRMHPGHLPPYIRDEIRRSFGAQPLLDAPASEDILSRIVSTTRNVTVRVENTNMYPVWAENIEIRYHEDDGDVGLMRGYVMRQVNRMPDDENGRLHSTGLHLMTQGVSAGMTSAAEALIAHGYVIGEIAVVNAIETRGNRPGVRAAMMKAFLFSTPSFTDPRGYRLDESADLRGWKPDESVVEIVNSACGGALGEVVAGDMYDRIQRTDGNIHRHHRPVVMLMGEMGRAIGVDTTLSDMVSTLQSRIEDDLVGYSGSGGSDGLRNGQIRLVVGSEANVGGVEIMEGDFA